MAVQFPASRHSVGLVLHNNADRRDRSGRSDDQIHRSTHRCGADDASDALVGSALRRTNGEALDIISVSKEGGGPDLERHLGLFTRFAYRVHFWETIFVLKFGKILHCWLFRLPISERTNRFCVSGSSTSITILSF